MKTTVYNSDGSIASQTNTRATTGTSGGGTGSGGTVATYDRGPAFMGVINNIYMPANALENFRIPSTETNTPYKVIRDGFILGATFTGIITADSIMSCRITKCLAGQTSDAPVVMPADSQMNVQVVPFSWNGSSFTLATPVPIAKDDTLFCKVQFSQDNQPIIMAALDLGYLPQ